MADDILKAAIKATYCISASCPSSPGWKEGGGVREEREVGRSEKREGGSGFYSSESQEAQGQLVEWNGEAQPEGNNSCSLWRLSSAVWA